LDRRACLRRSPDSPYLESVQLGIGADYRDIFRDCMSSDYPVARIAMVAGHACGAQSQRGVNRKKRVSSFLDLGQEVAFFSC
jgi:hypothetical protein